MSKSLNETIEKFYLSILDYAGLKYKNGIIQHKDGKLGDITIDDKNITLPYFENLKNPGNRVIFHPLNENYINPEISTFNFYRKRLVLELNLKLSYLIINLITLSADVQLQQSIKSPSLLKMISDIGEADMQTIENFYHLIKASKKYNEEAFIFSIFLKKNGSIKNIPYAAIGKINFILPTEIEKALENKESNYKVYGVKLRKKDIIVLNNIFNILFPDYKDEEKYADGTDNKVFRYLNILLKISYIVANRINEVTDLIGSMKSESIKTEDCYSNLNWTNYIERLYELTDEIRAIPNNFDKDFITINKLKVDESKANNMELNAAETKSISPPVFNPNNINPIINTQSQVNIQPQQPLSPEEIIRNSLNTPYTLMPQQTMFPMQQPMIMPQSTPNWAIQETMRQQMFQPQTIPMQQTIQPMIPMQQSMFPQQPMVTQQPIMIQQPIQQQSGLQLNPLFINR